ncbi:MAG: Cell division protein FtsL [Clostridium sp.]
MIVMNSNKIVNGNNAMEAEYETNRASKKKKKVVKRNRKKYVKHKIKTMRNIALVFIVGVTLITRYCIIYNMQMEYNSIQNRINKIKRENENLKIDLMKYNNIEYIEDKAINKLNMVQTKKSSAVYVNLNNKIVKQETSDKDTDKFSGILNVLKQFKWR